MTINHNARGRSARDMHDAGGQLPDPLTSDKCSSTTHTTEATIPMKALPATRKFFDAWNSSSTGHQRAENHLAGSTGWRASRSLKLTEQYKGGLNGGKRVADTVGAGSEQFGKDGRKADGTWEVGAKGLRTGGQKSLVELWRSSKTSKTTRLEKDTEIKFVPANEVLPCPGHPGSIHQADEIWAESALEKGMEINEEADTGPGSTEAPSNPSAKQIFSGLCFYINGSTAPLVSDHRLRHMLAVHGANHSISLGRRTVTHVILGRANMHGGAGGGLAASKIQREIGRSGGKAVKFVTAEWVLESIKANCRLPESRFSPLKLHQESQKTMFGMMRPS